MSIVVLGTIFVDIKGYPLGKYIPQGRNAGRMEVVHGGVGHNVAVNIAGLEEETVFLSLVDDSAAGREVLEKLAKCHVENKYIRQVPGGMGTWLAIFDETGDVAGSVSVRPDLLPMGEVLDTFGDAIFSSAESIAVEFDMERELLERVFTYARKYRLPVYAVISNMSILLEHRDLLTFTDCLICNCQEAGMFFEEVFDNVAPEELAQKLPAKLRKAQLASMVVTMGGRGAVYADCRGENPVSGVCPAENVQVVDTTGAGDAFFSGVVVGLNRGMTLAQACRLGSHLSAKVIGSTRSVCRGSK